MLFFSVVIGAPTVYNSSLSFCPYNGSVCCDAQEDMGLRRQLGAMNISDPPCASVVKSILCAVCLSICLLVIIFSFV